MKPKLRDYLTIIFALLVIFICGCGVGFLIGEKEGRQEGPAHGRGDRLQEVPEVRRRRGQGLARQALGGEEGQKEVRSHQRAITS